MFNKKLNDQILSGAIGKSVSCTPKQLLCIIHIKLQTNKYKMPLPFLSSADSLLMI